MEKRISHRSIDAFWFRENVYFHTNRHTEVHVDVRRTRRWANSALLSRPLRKIPHRHIRTNISDLNKWMCTRCDRCLSRKRAILIKGAQISTDFTFCMITVDLFHFFARQSVVSTARFCHILRIVEVNWSFRNSNKLATMPKQVAIDVQGNELAFVLGRREEIFLD